jgi:hypothetical protein
MPLSQVRCVWQVAVGCRRRFPPPWSVDDPDMKLGHDCLHRPRRQMGPRSPMSIARMSRGADQRRICSPVTRRGASPPTSPSCRSCGGGPETPSPPPVCYTVGREECMSRLVVTIAAALLAGCTAAPPRAPASAADSADTTNSTRRLENQWNQCLEKSYRTARKTTPDKKRRCGNGFPDVCFGRTRPRLVHNDRSSCPFAKLPDLLQRAPSGR